MNLLEGLFKRNSRKTADQRKGNGKLSDKTKKRILSAIFAGIMAGSSAVGMTGCELSKGFQNIADSFDVITVTGPNGEVVRTNANKVKKTIQDLPEMLKMAADPSYVNENVEKIDSDTLAILSAIYSLDYMLDGFGKLNDENVGLLQQALPENKDEELIYVTGSIPIGSTDFNNMLYSIIVEKVSKRVVQEDYSMSTEVVGYNIKFLVPKSIETRDVGGKDLEYVTYYSCCGTEHDNETYYNDDGSCYRYIYPRKTFFDLPKSTQYITEGANEGISINYCEHTKPLFDALQDERVLEK